MQRNLLLIVCLFVCGLCFGQTPRFMIDLEVGYLRFKNDSIQFQKPKTISVSTSGCTEILSLGTSRRYEFGIRLEILVSKLTGEEKLLVGKAYYVRSNNQWKEIMKIEHQVYEFRPIALREQTD